MSKIKIPILKVLGILGLWVRLGRYELRVRLGRYEFDQSNISRCESFLHDLFHWLVKNIQGEPCGVLSLLFNNLDGITLYRQTSNVLFYFVCLKC